MQLYDPIMIFSVACLFSIFYFVIDKNCWFLTSMRKSKNQKATVINSNALYRIAIHKVSCFLGLNQCWLNLQLQQHHYEIDIKISTQCLADLCLFFCFLPRWCFLAIQTFCESRKNFLSIWYGKIKKHFVVAVHKNKKKNIKEKFFSLFNLLKEILK